MRLVLVVSSVTVTLAVAAAGCGGYAGNAGCTSDAECGAGNTCTPSKACVPKCVDDKSCDATAEKCSTAGGCVPKNGCGTDGECRAGQVCEGVSCVTSCLTASCAAGRTCLSTGHCSEPTGGAGGGSGAGGGPSCGGELFQAAKVQANFLIVLDRSGSMEETLPAGGSKWKLASDAVKTVTSAHQQQIRFGLSMFPGTAKCTEGSNAVPIGDAAAPAIAMSLPATATGSGTPIGAALELASKRPELTDATRANYVLLVTDGIENCGGNPVAAVRALAARGVKTYVVGFGADVDANRLSQMATEGGTARLMGSKYYQADDQSSLNTALAQIAAGAAGCDYKLAKAPPDLKKVFVAVDGNLINRDTAKQMGWDYNEATGRLTLYGGACDLVQKNAAAKVQIVYGCPDPTLIEGGGNGDGGYPPVVPQDGGPTIN